MTCHDAVDELLVLGGVRVVEAIPVPKARVVEDLEGRVLVEVTLVGELVHVVADDPRLLQTRVRVGAGTVFADEGAHEDGLRVAAP